MKVLVRTLFWKICQYDKGSSCSDGAANIISAKIPLSVIIYFIRYYTLQVPKMGMSSIYAKLNGAIKRFQMFFQVSEPKLNPNPKLTGATKLTGNARLTGTNRLTGAICNVAKLLSNMKCKFGYMEDAPIDSRTELNRYIDDIDR